MPQPVCGRFPSSRVCGCTIPCRKAMTHALEHLDQVRPSLFIGPLQAAYAHDILQRHGITHVVNASGQQYEEGGYARYLRLDVSDEPSADLSRLLAGAIIFISDALATGSAVLVHCEAGKSRSASITAAYLMATEGLPAADAIEAVRLAHPRSDPNPGFRKQLCDAHFLDELHSSGWAAGGAASARGGAQGPAVPRTVFISLSALLRKPWSKLAADPRLPSALFFFGSKRRWVFPLTAAEREESELNNPAYMRMAPELRDLILKKEAEGLVFWLKPDAFAYDGGLYSGDPAAYPRASEWLQRLTDPVTGAAYRPLLLDPAWWMAGGGFDRARARYTADAQAVVRNLQNGAHDYGPVCELLAQSNPNLLLAM